MLCSNDKLFQNNFESLLVSKELSVYCMHAALNTFIMKSDNSEKVLGTIIPNLDTLSVGVSFVEIS